MSGSALLINPWIYDFAAFDMWAFPLGLLYLSSILKNAGWEAHYIDCANRRHPTLRDKIPKEKLFHQGRYYDVRVEKPKALHFVPRHYKRYGISEEAFVQDLLNIKTPDVILVTSRMTYWYPGVKRAIKILRQCFPGTPIILGGIYATLCPDHARNVCKPDHVFAGEAETHIGELINEITGIPCKTDFPAGDRASLDILPLPDYESLPDTTALPLETSRGCPYHCSYCASRKLIPRYRRKSPERIADEIQYAVEQLKTEDFAFYDDALLFEPEKHFEKIADEIARRGIRARFHTPNGVFANEITPKIAEAMKAMGFHTIRISLETASVKRLSEMNRAILPSHFKEAVKNLRSAGFASTEIGAYIMAGLPNQTKEETREAIDFVIECGAIPHIAEYSPIPETKEWRRAVETSIKDIANEPLYHNNSVYYLINRNFDINILDELKHYLQERIRGMRNAPSFVKPEV
ncbi:B12-binding domain-containing radical SAM protein [Candidatus Sumerlaeota bacterium]|nr:B12-binding domain-containing radical SAM protein [Candidatus Sumerlaeota bacterium]